MYKLNRYFKNKTIWFWATMLITAVIDGLNSLFYDKSQDFFFKILNGSDTRSMFWLTGIYLLFIITVIFAAMMTTYKGRTYLTKKQEQIKKFSEAYSLMLILGFGIILMMPAFTIIGLTSSEASNFTDDQQNTWIMVLCTLFFILLAFALIKQKSRFVMGTAKYLWVYIPILTLISIFTGFSAAIWEFSLYDPATANNPDQSSKIIEFIVIFPLYALFFSAPRFLLLRKSYHLIPLLSALFTSGYFVWRSLEYISF